jgi:hypothetical protein
MRVSGYVSVANDPNLSGTRILIVLHAFLITATVLGTDGCSKPGSVPKALQPLGVELVEGVQRNVPIYREWIGTLDGFVNADIKAQVSGYLTRQAYTEGTFVSKGTKPGERVGRRLHLGNAKEAMPHQPNESTKLSYDPNWALRDSFRPPCVFRNSSRPQSHISTKE